MTKRARCYVNRSWSAAKKTTVDGIQFDSGQEAKVYGYLKLRQAAGEIAGLQIHRKFILHGLDGSAVCEYTPDFCYMEGSRFTVHEVKGRVSRDYPLRRGFFLAEYQDYAFVEQKGSVLKWFRREVV